MFKKFNFLIITVFLLHFTVGYGQSSSLDISLSSNDTVICPGNTVTINISISGQLPVWIEYTTITSGAPEPIKVESVSDPLKLVLGAAGNYTITKYGNNTNSKAANIPITVSQTNSPSAVLSGGGEFCANETINPVDVSFSGNPPWELTYQVDYGNAITQTFSQNRVTLLNTQGIINIREVTDKYCINEDLTDTQKIVIYDVPVAEISGPDEFCVNDTAIYSFVKHPNYKADWVIHSDGNFEVPHSVYENTLSVSWNKAGNYTIQLTVSNSNSNCVSNPAYYPVKVLDLPQTTKKVDTVFCFHNMATLTYVPPSLTENTIFWPSTGDTSKQIDINGEGTYIYIESIPFGCSDTGYVNVIDKCRPELIVPEAFTPNNDGINDVLKIFGFYYNPRLSIYSSNGELVYFSTQPKQQPWDGKCNDKKMPNGVYFWEAGFTDVKGEIYHSSGKVMLIR